MSQREEAEAARSPGLTLVILFLILLAAGVWQWQYVQVRSPGGYQYYRVNRATGVAEVTRSRGYTRARGFERNGRSWSDYSR